MKPILTLYDLRLASDIVAAAEKIPGCIVICNPWDGPGKEKIAKWKSTIERLKGGGAKVLGYVDAVQWPGEAGSPEKKKRTKTPREITAESERWITFYDVSDIFLDDAVKDPEKSVFPGDMVNPGSPPDYKTPKGTGVVTWEQPGIPTKKPKGATEYSPAAAMCLEIPESKLDTAIDRCNSLGFAYFFATDASEAQAYSRVPSYLKSMIQKLK